MSKLDFWLRSTNRSNTKAVLQFGGRSFPCALGESGITAQKREGDMASPAGTFQMLGGFYRADRGPKPFGKLPMQPTRPTDGWCDDPLHTRYNQLVKLPFDAYHEKLWREDQLYDIVVVLDQNLHPRIPGGGSAIFFHIAAPNFTPTAGCVAVSHATMRHALAYATRGSSMQIA
ncbi:MAG: L,D-transpeptidase [Hyphomicrobiales bacterium]